MMVYFKLGRNMRKILFCQWHKLLGKKISEFPQQESNLWPSTHQSDEWMNLTCFSVPVKRWSQVKNPTRATTPPGKVTANVWQFGEAHIYIILTCYNFSLTPCHKNLSGTPMIVFLHNMAETHCWQFLYSVKTEQISNYFEQEFETARTSLIYNYF